MSINEIKLGFIALLAGLSSWLGILATPIYVLCLVMMIDYITGIMAAGMAGELSSAIGAWGIAKKVGYLLLIVLGGVVDYLMTVAVSQLGMDFKLSFFFALVVTLWLILNELISILENLFSLGVPIPPFLNKIVDKLKIAIEQRGNIDA